jgi:hypothetical protein
MMNNKKVAAYQQMLAGLGYYHGRIDGDYGKQTLAAVKQFQMDRGLTPDGHIGIGAQAETGPALEAAWSQKLAKPPNAGLIDQVAALNGRNLGDVRALTQEGDRAFPGAIPAMSVMDQVAALNGRNLADRRALTQEGDRGMPTVRQSIVQAMQK